MSNLLARLGAAMSQLKRAQFICFVVVFLVLFLGFRAHAATWPNNYSDVVKLNVPKTLLALNTLDFCPNYGAMNEAAKHQAWADILQSISLPESGWKPTLRYRETGLGIDSVTHLPVYSEGLLQLSYQDARNYPMASVCQEISWAKDKSKSVSDPTRTILNPRINLVCGLQIMNRLITRYPKLGAREALGKYWSTMRLGKCEARKYLRLHSACGAQNKGC